jgi:hypothetical protein
MTDTYRCHHSLRSLPDAQHIRGIDQALVEDCRDQERLRSVDRGGTSLERYMYQRSEKRVQNSWR